ncbi:MAG: glycosyltransferase [Bacilli bacterium]|nr:glycosyltransferase [Bacilli bacterium]
MSIPKIVHSIWLGKNPKNDLVQRCAASWRLHLSGYTFMEWNEDNLDLNVCPYAKKMYDKKNWAFASDPLRLYVLKKFGGIYFDVDVMVRKPFDRLLDAHLFLGFLFDCALGAGVIGAEPNSSIIKKLLAFYTNDLDTPVINNSPITWFFLKHFSDFLLTGQTQSLEGGINIFHRKYFDSPTKDPLMGFAENANLGSWGGGDGVFPECLKRCVRNVLGKTFYNDLRMIYARKKIPEFYPTYKNHVMGKRQVIVPSDFRVVFDRVLV